MSNSHCQTGTIAELLFCAQAGMKGWDVFVPVGHAQAADVCLVKAPGRPVSVQVKTAGWDKKQNCYQINACKGGAVKVAYRAGAFDVLAAWLPDREQFVFWTLEDIAGRLTVRYSPLRHRAPGNWHILQDVAFSAHKLTNSDAMCASVFLNSHKVTP